MPSETYSRLDRQWKSTCRLLLGEEIGKLEDYRAWLEEYMAATAREKSSVSGKEVVLACADYPKSAKFVSLEETGGKAATLSINEVKDIDSIMEAISEKWEYCGNKILDNSRFVESSDAVVDSAYVSGSTTIQGSSYVYASSIITTNSRSIFGSLRSDNGEFAIRCVRCSDFRRCFETRLSISCSDLYFCATCMNSHDLLFCFNQRNKSYRIGNLQLPKDKYKALKEKIVGESRDELKRKKKFPSIFELVPNKETALPTAPAMKIKEVQGDIGIINKSFASAFRILFKKEPGDIRQYEKWLSKHVGSLREFTTPFGNKAYALPGKCYPVYSLMPDKRVVSSEESPFLEGLHLDESEIVGLASIRNSLGKIGYFTDEMFEGTCHGAIETLAAVDSSFLYKASAYKSEYGAYNLYLVTSKYAFGGGRLSNSQFCINCYDSDSLNRCFELDFCSKCADSYFCHNCENVHDSMFCFNVKNLRYAIGNSEVGKEAFEKAKRLLLAEITSSLEKTHDYKRSIYNITGKGN